MPFVRNFILLFCLTVSRHGIVCPTVTCDFEIDQCAWNMDSTWQVFPSGSTPETASSGPVSDHTNGGGNYARFMAIRLNQSDQFGVMRANTSLQASTPFSFWYFMHGTQIGTLSLLVNEQVLWQKSQRQGLPAWYLASLTLPAGSDLRLVFSANRTGLGRSSDIALDDILLEGEAIPSTRTTMTRPTTTPRTRYNASCDFDIDKDLCGWKSDTQYGWAVLTERADNVTMGPASDYSSITRANADAKVCKIPYDDKGNQYYCLPNKKVLQCKGSDNKPMNCRDGGFVQIRSGTFDDVGERSQFESPTLDALSTDGCVQFQYNIAGTDNDWLNVYVQDYYSGLLSCTWHKNGSSVPDRWVAAEAPLPLQSDGKYQIIFEARKGLAGGSGLVSIDHLVISPKTCSGNYVIEQCPVEETTTTTATTSTTGIPTTTSTSATETSTSTTTEATTATETETTSTTTGTVVTSTTTTVTQTTTATTTTTSIWMTATSTTTSTTAPFTTTSMPITSTTSTRLTESSTSYTTTTDIGIPDRTTKKPSLSTPGIVGIVIGVLVVIALAVPLAMLYIKRRRIMGYTLHSTPASDEVVSHYSGSTSSEGSVRLENLQVRASTA